MGKSLLYFPVQALFRIVEPTSGTIYIDGLDITEMGLFDLRSRLALVPQVRKLTLFLLFFDPLPFSCRRQQQRCDRKTYSHFKFIALSRQTFICKLIKLYL